MPSLTLRFQKFDAYKNAIFIASSKKEDETETYNMLKSYYEKIFPLTDTFLPIYDSLEYNYATIRFKKDSKHCHLKENHIYLVDFELKQSERDGKIYFNAFSKRIRLEKKADVVDYGSVVALE